MLTNLGMCRVAQQSLGLTRYQRSGREPNATAYFPPGTNQTMGLPAYLTALSTLLAPLSQPSELLSAFAAFDEDDSGQIDVEDLRDALLHTAPEPGSGSRSMSARDVEQALEGFTGRRAFSKQQGLAKKGEVFRYQEFVGNVSGSNANGGVEVKSSGTR
jgi:Ca2+-binding EF-hand superfamily protein